MRYRVRLLSKGTLRLGQIRTFRCQSDEVVVTDAFQRSSQPQMQRHVGVLFTAEVDAPGILEAIALAKGRSSQIADLLTTAQSTAIEDPIPLFALDIDPTKPDREFAQMIYNAPQLRDFRRVLDDEEFRLLSEALDALRASDERSAARVDRALHYLRQSILEGDPIDRFEDLWAGLESINHLIRKKYDSPVRYEVMCPRCKYPLLCSECREQVAAPDNASGIDYIVTTLLKLPGSEARLLRSKRIQIAHSTAQLPDVLENLEHATNVARMTLLAGIYDIIGLPIEPSFLRRKPLQIVGNAPLTVVAVLHDLPMSALEAGTPYPQLKLEVLELALPTAPGADPALPHPEVPDTSALEVYAVQVVVAPVNFAGTIGDARAFAGFASDPEQQDTPFEIIVLPLRPTVQGD